LFTVAGLVLLAVLGYGAWEIFAANS